MEWYKDLYTSETVTGVEKIIMKEVSKKGGAEGYYLIILPRNGIGLLEILPSGKAGNKRDTGDMFVVGLAGTKDEADVLAGRIVADIYEKTGAFDTRKYFGRE